MPSHGGYLVLLTAAALALLLILILVVKLHAFLAMLISSMALGLAAGMPPEQVLKSIQNGFGDTLGFITVVVALGAMIGRFLEYSGGGRSLADWLLAQFGKDRAAWAMLAAAFLVGLPIFFEVAFIIMVPLVWNLARESKRSLLYYGVPTFAALTIVHSLVPPHPAPAAAAQLMGADLGHTILFGILVSIPMAVVSGVWYGTWIAKRMYIPVPEIATLAPETKENGPWGAPPAPATVMILLLLPVMLIFGATLANMLKLPYGGLAVFLGHPFTALTIAALAAIYFFGIRRGLTFERAAKLATESLAPAGTLLCIMGGGGALKQIIVDSGVGPYAGHMLVTASISPLIVAFVIAAALKFAQGSATVAIITAAGIVAPIVKSIPGYNADLTMLALCCGGTSFSHVNDAGFWIVNQYFGMTVPQTLKTWTASKVISAIVGLGIVLAAQAFIRG